MDVRQLVVRAHQPAVATDPSDRILAANREFQRLIGWIASRPPAGRPLGQFLRLPQGAVPGRQPPTLWEALMLGDGGSGFELELTQSENGLRLAASPIVVLAAAGAYEIVYLLEPLRRRRRADQVIDRLLATTEPGSSGGLPTWWSERRSLEAELTRRQLEVLCRLAQGESLPTIAGALGTSLNTVRTHVQALYERLGVHSRAQAVAFALRHLVGGAAPAPELGATMVTPRKRNCASGAALQTKSPPIASTATPPVSLASRVKS
ncbi:MAG: response regulator transcription factor [Thermoanaerobaculia bacterium]